MSTIIASTPHFDWTRTEPHRIGRFRQNRAHTPWSVAAMVFAFFSALDEGRAARQTYERLRRAGVAHDPALRTALGAQS